MESETVRVHKCYSGIIQSYPHQLQPLFSVSESGVSDSRTVFSTLTDKRNLLDRNSFLLAQQEGNSIICMYGSVGLFWFGFDCLLQRTWESKTRKLTMTGHPEQSLWIPVNSLKHSNNRIVLLKQLSVGLILQMHQRNTCSRKKHPTVSMDWHIWTLSVCLSHVRRMDINTVAKFVVSLLQASDHFHSSKTDKVSTLLPCCSTKG